MQMVQADVCYQLYQLLAAVIAQCPIGSIGWQRANWHGVGCTIAPIGHSVHRIVGEDVWWWYVVGFAKLYRIIMIGEDGWQLRGVCFVVPEYLVALLVAGIYIKDWLRK